MGLLSGLLNLYGGYGQGQQAKRDYSLRKQQMQDDYDLRKQQGGIAEQQAAEQKRIDDLNIAHAQTVADQDKSATAFRSKLRLPPASVWMKYTPAEQAAYYQRRQSAALAAGDTETAKSAQDAINNLSLADQRYSQSDYNRGARSQLAYSQADYNQARAKAAGTAQQTAVQIAGMNNRAKMTMNAATVQSRGLVAQYNGQARYAVANLAGAYMTQGKDIMSATQMAIATYNGQVKEYLPKVSAAAMALDPAGAAAAVAPSMQAPINIYTGSNESGGAIPQFQPASWLTGGAAAAGGGGAVHHAQAPARAQSSIDWTPQKLQTLVSRLHAVGRDQADQQVREALAGGKIDSATANQALRMAGYPPLPLPIGGSKGTNPFEQVRYVSPVAQQDMPHTSTAMQSAFYGMLQFSPTVTSVMHGGHVKDSAHYDGRAVDVGAFGGVGVGYNAPTWQAIMYAISSHRFSKIGTIAAIVKNQAAQAFARANGVDLFEDEGSGPHVHLQVGA